MAIQLRKRRLMAALVLSTVSASSVFAAGAPTVPQALGIKPVQKDVEYDTPAAEEFAKCTIKPEKSGGKTGWVLRNAKDQILRNFVDTDGDNRVDQWSYFKDGVEVYRDIDSNHNGKADQSRWLNAAGTRWGLDKNEDRVLDAWDVISAEEVSSELVAAIRDNDRARFERLLINSRELAELGLGPAKLEQLQKRVTAAPAEFEQFVRTQKVITPHSTWVYFGGGRPGTVPAGTDESTADITVYESVAAMVETDGKNGQLPIAVLVKVRNTWKLLDTPDEKGGSPTGTGGFIATNANPTSGGDGNSTNDAPSKHAQELMDELSKLDQIPNPTPEQVRRKADILEELAVDTKPGKDRADWYRQLADVVSAAAQIGTYPEGVERLETLYKKLAEDGDKDLSAYVQFRFMTAAYNRDLSEQKKPYEKVQAQWLEDLEAFVKEHPTSIDSAEAMLQLAMAQEFAGDDQNALKWYNRVVKNFPKTAASIKSEGAVRRLSCVGKSIALKGKSLGGKTVDLSSSAFKGKVVLIHYWSSDIDACKLDLPTIEKMTEKYGTGFAVIGVCLDNDGRAVQAYLRGNPVPWANIWEEGGLNNRLANEMGILTLPTMILVDQKGNVINRNLHTVDLDEELKGILKARMANRPVN